ncbi:MAG TPA: spore germination protein GerW family protein [Methanotrichaceae archaeon]|nr:spore germination protein GerW family protein [Methanotrichaceae archaeon]
MAAEDAIRTTVDELLKALSANNIIGEPIETEDKILIPITKMGMGFGTGTGQGTGEMNKGEIAGGAGGGVGVFPVAIVVIFKGVTGSEGVKVMPLAAPSPLAESMVHIANTLVERLTNRREGGEKKPAHTATIEVE